MKIIEQLANTCAHIPMTIMKKLLHTHPNNNKNTRNACPLTYTHTQTIKVLTHRHSNTIANHTIKHIQNQRKACPYIDTHANETHQKPHPCTHK